VKKSKQGKIPTFQELVVKSKIVTHKPTQTHENKKLKIEQKTLLQQIKQEGFFYGFKLNFYSRSLKHIFIKREGLFFL